jgi:hypothetical protein
MKKKFTAFGLIAVALVVGLALMRAVPPPVVQAAPTATTTRFFEPDRMESLALEGLYGKLNKYMADCFRPELAYVTSAARSRIEESERKHNRVLPANGSFQFSPNSGRWELTAPEGAAPIDSGSIAAVSSEK